MGDRGASLTPAVEDGTATAAGDPTAVALPCGQSPAASPLTRGAIVRFVALVTLLGALVTFALAARVDPRELVGQLSAGPIPLPLLVIGGGAILTCAFVPRIALAFASGTLFGTAMGACYVLIAVTCGAVLAFGIGRLLGRTFVERRLRGRLAALDRRLVGSGLWAVAVARMVPIAHFGLSNYAFGTSSVGLLRYVLGTLVGIAPATLAYAALGDAAARGHAAHASLAGVVVAVLSIAGVVGSALLWRGSRNRGVEVPNPRAHQ